MIWDVDDVLNPGEPGPDHVRHQYRGPVPAGYPGPEPGHGETDDQLPARTDVQAEGEVEGVVYLHAELAGWMQELTDAGAEHAWATSWGHLAPDWLADTIGHPAARHWPVIDVPLYRAIRFGHSLKWPAITAWLDAQPDRPVIWFDDVFGGKDITWAEDRTRSGIPTLLRHITAPTGLGRADIDAALDLITGARGDGT